MLTKALGSDSRGLGSTSRIVFNEESQWQSIAPIAEPVVSLWIQDEQRRQNAALYQRISEIDELIKEHTAELDTLVRDHRKAKGARLLEVLQRQADEIEETIAGLERERAKLTSRISENVLSDEDTACDTSCHRCLVQYWRDEYICANE